MRSIVCAIKVYKTALWILCWHGTKRQVHQFGILNLHTNCNCADGFTGTFSREEREPYREWDEAPRPSPFRGRWRGRGRGRGIAGHDDDRRPHWDRDRDRPRRYEDDHGSGRGGGRGSYNDRFDGNRESGYSNASPNNYAMPAQQQYAEPSAAAPVSDDT